MGRHVLAGAAPPPQPHDQQPMRECRIRCCWTPHGHAPHAPNCTCHRKENR